MNRMALSLNAQQQASQPQASIVGVGVGQEGIRLYVTGGTLSAGMVPSAFNGLQVTVIQTPGFTVTPPPGIQAAINRPTLCGVSAGHVASVTTGTLGCLVQDRQGTRYALSNNHVFAASNNGTIGDLIVQPGPSDGGVAPGDTIARLAMWVPVFFSSSYADPDRKINYIDAATAELTNPALVQPDIQRIGRVSGMVDASTGQAVHKHGRTTGYTTGTVGGISVDIFVNFGGQLAWFKDQIEINTPGFSDHGDSGSLIVTNPANEAVGLLFAGDGTRTLANPIGDVLMALNVALA